MVDETEENDYKQKLSKQPWFDPNHVKIPQPSNFLPEPYFVTPHAWAGNRRCPQWNGNTGKQCGNLVTPGRPKCRSHGGGKRGKRGINHHSYKHGRYTKAVAGNTELSSAYGEALKQKGLLNLSPNIAMTDAQLSLLYQHHFALTDEIIKMMDACITEWDKLKIIIPRTDPSVLEQTIQFNALFHLLFQMLNSKRAFDIRDDQLNERRRRQTETETKRQLGMAETVLKAEAIAVFGTMGSLFRELVLRIITDRTKQQELLGGFSEIIDTHVLGFFGTNKKEE